MANKFGFAVLVAKIMAIAAACVMVFGCDQLEMSTHLGVESEVTTKGQTGYDNISLVAKFDTTANKLFTVEQNVSGEIVSKQDSEVSRQRFDQDLDLNIVFSSKPAKVYVAEKELLSNVGQTSFNKGTVTSSEVAKDPFKLVTFGQRYDFAFNANEVVTADASWQILKVAAKDSALAAATVQNVSYNKFTAVQNNVLSNADSTVFDVNLYFTAELSVEGSRHDMIVRVPVQRIFKNGKVPDNFLKRIEDLSYNYQFDTTVCRLFAVKQEVAGNVVSYNNATVLGKTSFRENLDLIADAAIAPKKVWVSSENALTQVAMTSQSKGDLRQTKSVNGRFVKSSFEQNYQFNFNEGERVYINAAYEALAYGDTTLAHAAISNIIFSNSKSVRNTELSNADSTVYNVNLFFVATVERENGAKIADYTIRVPYVRIYKHDTPTPPDEFETKLEDTDYEAEFQTEIALLETVKQNVSGYEVVYKNNKEVVSKKHFVQPLDLGAAFTVPDRVYVDNENALNNVKLANSSHDGDKVNVTTNGRFAKTTRSLNYNYKFNADEQISAATVYELLAYGDTNFVYSSIRNITYATAKVTPNEEASSETLKVNTVTLYFDVEVAKNEPKTPKTKAANEEITTYRVAVPYERALSIKLPEDELVSKSYRDAKREIIDANTERLSFTEVETWSVSGEKSRTITKNLSRHFSEPALQWVYTVNNSYNTTGNGSSTIRENQSKDGNWTVTTRYMQYSSTATNGVNPFQNVYSYDFQKAVYVDADGYYTVTFDFANWNISEAGSNVSQQASETTKDGVTYLVYDYQNKINTNYVISNDSYKANASAAAKIAIVKPTDKLIGKSYRDAKREIIDANTERLSFTEVETWSVSGEKSRTITKNLSRHFSEPALQWVYTVNNSYNTTGNGSSTIRENQSKDGNWTVTTRYMQYSSTATNGVNPFQNVYSYDFQKAVYVDADGYYTVTFDFANWNISEAGSNVSQQASETTKDGVTYLVYDYQNKINTNYVISNDSYKANASAAAKIAVEKPIEPIIPEEWGKIIGMGVSAVPADQVRGEYAQLCFTLRTEKGAVAVIAPMSQTVPTTEQILSGYFVKGNFGSEYNSGYYTTSANRGSYAEGKWAPAIAKDLTDRIAYYKDNTCVRNVRNTSLVIWNWRGGNISTVVEGYNFSVSNGTLTITHNGKVVMKLR